MLFNSFVFELIVAKGPLHPTVDDLRRKAVLASLTSNEVVHSTLTMELAKGGLSVPGFNILAVLASHDPEPVRRSRIVASAGLSEVAAATALWRLEDSGLIARNRDRTDRRSILFGLSTTGRQRAASVVTRCCSSLATIAEGLDEVQLQEFIAANQTLKAGSASLLSSPPDPDVIERVIIPFTS